MKTLEILYKDKNVVIANKPCGMPSQSDPGGDKDAMTAASELLEGLSEQSSLWLVHRLDRTVGGLIAFARNKKAAAELSKSLGNGNMLKKYLAVCHGSATEGTYTDYLYKDSALGKAYVVKTLRQGSKEARLTLEKICEREEKSLVSVTLDTGRFHQIRAQLSSRGNSLVGDKKYGSRDQGRRGPALFAYRLSFTLFDKSISASRLPDLNEYPWNIFSDELQNLS